MAEVKPTTIEGIHKVILRTAAGIANRDIVNHPELAEFQVGGTGEVFFEATNRSTGGGLALGIEPGFLQADPKKVTKLRQVGLSAIKQAIRQHPDLFGSLILGEAKQGRNYFDRFKSNSQVKSI